MKEIKKLSLQEEIEREAREIEKEILNHPELDDIHVTEEMDAALLAKILAYEEEKEEEKSARQELEGKKNKGDVEFSEELVPDLSVVKNTDAGTETVVYRRKKKRLLLVSLVAVLVLVLGAGMTSVGSKSYWKSLWDKLYGKESIQIINVEDMDEKTSIDGDDATAYREIDDAVGISAVRLIYKPDGMWLDQCIVDTEQGQAKLFYKYHNEIIQYIVYMNNEDSSYGIKTEDVKVDEYSVSTDRMDIKVEEYQVPKYSEHRQIANFEYQGIKYQLKGIMEREEFEKILKNLFFYKKA